MIFAVFIFCWFGGLMFGVMGDCYGCCLVMVISIVFFLVGMLVCGFVLGYIIMFIVCLVIGMGMVGEYGFSVIYVIESWLKYLCNKVSGFLILGFFVGVVVVV